MFNSSLKRAIDVRKFFAVLEYVFEKDFPAYCSQEKIVFATSFGQILAYYITVNQFLIKYCTLLNSGITDTVAPEACCNSTRFYLAITSPCLADNCDISTLANASCS